jgi:hypothetical protein
MTTRLPPSVYLDKPTLDNTNTLLAEVLTHVLKDHYVHFLVEAGEGRNVVNRLRMQLSRQRKKLRDKGKKFKQFMLYSTIHSETRDGIRYDAIVMWKQQSVSQLAEQDIENILMDGVNA